MVEDVSATRGQFVRWAQSAFIAGRARAHARLGRPDRGLELLAAVLPALQRAASWGWTYLRTVCDAAETLWLLDRRDHLPVIEAARNRVVEPILPRVVGTREDHRIILPGEPDYE